MKIRLSLLLVCWVALAVVATAEESPKPAPKPAPKVEALAKAPVNAHECSGATDCKLCAAEKMKADAAAAKDGKMMFMTLEDFYGQNGMTWLQTVGTANPGIVPAEETPTKTDERK